MDQRLCRYFASGTCRFGSRCHFSHDTSGAGYGSGNYGGFQSSNRYAVFSGGDRGFDAPRSYQQQPQQQQQQQQQRGGYGQTGSITDMERQMLDLLKQEISDWGRGQQWDLSCFAPSKSGACVPGLEDVSPEECRAAAYACKGDPQRERVFVDAVRTAVQDVNDWRRRATGGDPDVLRLLLALAKDENPSSFPASVGQAVVNLKSLVQQLTSSAPSPSAPAAVSPQSFSFKLPPSGVAPNAAPFGGTQQPTSVFGGGGAGAGSPGLFGKPASVFGGAAAQQVQQQPQPTASVFGGGAFGRTSAAPQAPVFGGGAFQPAGAGSAFGGGGGGGSGLFGKPAAGGVFGGQTAAASGGGGGAPGLLSGGSNVFGTPAVSNGSPLGDGFDANFYSKLDSLSEEELNQYKAEAFTLRLIPSVPPPRELC